MIGAFVTAAFFFAYTAVKMAAQDVGFGCTIGLSLNVYHGTLFAYTHEVLPSAHRATGNGITVAGNRAVGIPSAVIATTADTKTTAPVFICGGLLVAMELVSVVFPLGLWAEKFLRATSTILDRQPR